MNPKLVVVGGDVKTKEVHLVLPTVIGRGRSVTLTLPHPLVSRRHCEIYQKNNRLIVRDLGSLNGTFVNNKRIEGEHPLDPEQLLTIGSVTFRAIYESKPSVAEVATHYDPVAARETNGKANFDTDEIELPQMDQPAVADAHSKPMSNPRPMVDTELAETFADGFQTADIHAEEFGEGLLAVSQNPSANDSQPEHPLDGLPPNNQVGNSFIDQVSFNESQNREPS